MVMIARECFVWRARTTQVLMNADTRTTPKHQEHEQCFVPYSSVTQTGHRTAKHANFCQYIEMLEICPSQ